MSVETNKALLRRFVEEIVNQGNITVAPELIAEDFVELDPFPGQAPGRAGLIESIERLRTAFPDLIWSLDEMVAEEEKVASSHTWSGTHLGEFLGIAPTGKRVRMTCMIFDTWCSHRIWWRIRPAPVRAFRAGCLPGDSTDRPSPPK